MMKKLVSTGNGNQWMVQYQKHRLGEKSTGPNPTDRGKSGTKRSLLVEGQGIPIGITVDGANRHDMKMTKATLQSIVVCRPQQQQQQHHHHHHLQQIPNNNTSVLTRVMTTLKYTSYLRNMDIPCIFAREEEEKKNTIMVTKKEEKKNTKI